MTKAWAALAVCCLALAGCTSATSGHGSGGSAGGASTGRASSHTTVAASTPASSTPASGSTGISSAPRSAVPTPVASPADCSTAVCAQAGAATLGSGYDIVLRGNETVDGVGATFVELRYAGVGVQWREIRFETPGQLVCDVAESIRNCGFTTYVGAHGSNAYPVVFDGAGLVFGAPVNSDTPGMRVGDLDGDNRVDAYGLLNNYDPSYATGKVQWRTFRRSADARSWVSTGCGPLAADHAPPEPTTLLTGTCSA